MNKFVCVLLVSGFAAAALGGCRQRSAAPTADTDAAAGQIRQLEAQWVKAYAARDAAGAVANYAPDAALMPAGMKRMTDARSIEAGLKGMLADPNFRLSFAPEKVEVARSGDLAYTRGTYTLRVTDPKTKQPATETGSYMTTYKKQPDGSWKAEDDMTAPGG